MPIDLSDINISSSVGEELTLSPYFPTVFSTGQKQYTTSDIIVDILTSSGVSTYLDTYNDSIITTLLYYTLNDTDNNYIINTVLDTEEISLLLESVLKTTFDYYDIDINSKFKTTTKLEWLVDTTTSYYNYTTFTSKVNTLDSKFKLYEKVVYYENNLDNILYLSNSKMFALHCSIYCAKEKILDELIYDIEVGYGRISYVLSDVYSTLENNLNIINDIYSSNQIILNISNDVQTIKGTIINLQHDIYSSALNTINISTDIRLNSLYIVNFSLHFEDYSYLGDYLYVDIIDYLFTVDTSNSYFEVDGTYVNTEFNNITNGVRARCIITDDFIKNEEMVVKVTASNLIGDVFYEHFYLLFGYSMEFNGRILFDYNKNILVHGCATNLVECPNTECNSFSFTTIDYPSYNLAASISCVVSEDLTAEVYPQSTAFFYGRSYKIVVSNIKDNSGNYLESVTMEFTIEDR